MFFDSYPDKPSIKKITVLTAPTIEYRWVNDKKILIDWSFRIAATIGVVGAIKAFLS